ncbi:MBL fold metallo-hydrolase [Panacibacter ginsenosidivorans]|uniref:MBL fold metallo-hydrolase n=1 Tax=Panacibacter ginsenosidivorans TaxID=1813871 RepID=A0A5B8V4R1_9BACT|nr:MBL fold metallo-hydrolase [Panacibacter ginsenosidivorans]QEC65803.1 MBL fold metallo-hydrolase [Panacibacter ginsenosidivorans]
MEKTNSRFRLLRHATLLIEMAGKKILVDPMLSKKEAMAPVQNASNSNRMPLVDLPVDERELNTILDKTDAILVTHTHRDHWDIAAQQQINKEKMIICQPEDKVKIREQGFSNVESIDKVWQWNNIKIHRTNGQHGTGEIGKLMGTVSGYVLENNTEKLYIAGDTIWCPDVEEAITLHQPTHIVVNGGGAQFLEGGPITMTTNDVIKLSRLTKTNISVAHLETVNHCLQRRPHFRAAIVEHNLTNQVMIPNDGEWVTI